MLPREFVNTNVGGRNFIERTWKASTLSRLGDWATHREKGTPVSHLKHTSKIRHLQFGERPTCSLRLRWGHFTALATRPELQPHFEQGIVAHSPQYDVCSSWLGEGVTIAVHPLPKLQ